MNTISMMSLGLPVIHEPLTAAISCVLDGARIEAQRLPECPGISLYLLNPDYPQHTLTREQMLAVLREPAYWVFCWASGQALARWLLAEPHWVKGKRVLDFGCGSGVVAVAAALAGAAFVVACDIDPLARAAASANRQLNQVDYAVKGDWNDFDDGFDLVIAADVLYDRENLPLLQQFLQRAPEVLVADSRIKHFDVPPYRAIDRLVSSTWPDLDEFDEFRDVCIYHACRE
jgi:predicted nicotinamide N-methyase